MKPNDVNNSRRKFIKTVGTAAIAFPFVAFMDVGEVFEPSDILEIHLFSKHLHFLDLKAAGQIAAELGFAGLDLTVRPKGHVLPENVTTGLPKAIQDLKDGGSTCKMITTAISDIDNKSDLDVIKAAAEQSIEFYRCNWFKYHEAMPMKDSIHIYQKKVKELGKVNKRHNIVGCYQNHAGTKIGASFWEVKQLLTKVDSDYFGTQYDIRHATVDSGLSWKNGFHLLQDSIKTIVLKDFKWGKVNGKWKVVNVPIGEGMVDFDAYFKLLKQSGLRPPVSLHCEYPLGGAEKGKYEITVDKKVVFDAMKKDLVTIQKLWKAA